MLWFFVGEVFFLGKYFFSFVFFLDSVSLLVFLVDGGALGSAWFGDL